MRDLLIVAIFLAVPFIPWKRFYAFLWGKFQLYLPNTVTEFDTLLRKKWPLIRTRHLFLFSFILVNLAIFFYLFGSFLGLATVSLSFGIMAGIIVPFLLVYIFKPNIEASFLFEVRLIYNMLRTQVYAGATPQEALHVVSEVPGILQKDLEEILLAWGGDIHPILQGIANKYATDELNLLLSLIREINLAGASNQKEVIEAFDELKGMMENEIEAKEAASDEKEMDFLELSSVAVLIALFFIMVFPIIGDIVIRFTNI